MTLNKKILAAAIASVLPTTSFALIDLDASGGEISYPSELSAPVNLASPGGTLNTPPAITPGIAATGLLSVTVKLGVSIVGSSKYVRLDFPGTTLTTALTSANFSTLDNAPLEVGGSPGTFTIAGGGGVGANYVIVEISGAKLSNLDSFGFILDGAALLPDGVIKADSITAHNIQYRIYDTATQAVFPNDPGSLALNDVTHTWYKFSQGLVRSCAPLDSRKISFLNPDVFTGTSLFTSLDPNTPLFKMTVNINSSLHHPDGSSLDIADFYPAGSKFTVGGNFNFVSELDFAYPGTTDPAALSSTTAVWEKGAVNDITLPLNASDVYLTNDGDPMVPGVYSLLMKQPSPLPAGTIAVPDFFQANCGELTFNGSRDRVDLGLTPGGVYPQFFRVTNPTGTKGAVQFTMWNDQGVPAKFNMNHINVGGVVLPLELDAYASSPLISIQQMYNAAVSQNPGFTFNNLLTGTPGKLRIEARGAFGENELDSHFQFSTNGAEPLLPSISGGKESNQNLESGIHLQAVNGGNFSQSN